MLSCPLLLCPTSLTTNLAAWIMSWLDVRSTLASLNVSAWCVVHENVTVNHSSLCVCASHSCMQTPTAFMTSCSNVKSWSIADSCMNSRVRPCQHIVLTFPSHIFIVELCTRVGRQRESAISSDRREVTVFFDCETSVVLQLLFCNRTVCWGSIAKQQLPNKRCFGHSAVTTWHGFVHCREKNCQLQN